MIKWHATSVPQVFLIKKNQDLEHLQPDLLELDGINLDTKLLIPIEDSFCNIFERFDSLSQVGRHVHVSQEPVPFVTLIIEGME